MIQRWTSQSSRSAQPSIYLHNLPSFASIRLNSPPILLSFTSILNILNKQKQIQNPRSFSTIEIEKTSTSKYRNAISPTFTPWRKGLPRQRAVCFGAYCDTERETGKRYAMTVFRKHSWSKRAAIYDIIMISRRPSGPSCLQPRLCGRDLRSD